MATTPLHVHTLFHDQEQDRIEVGLSLPGGAGAGKWSLTGLNRAEGVRQLAAELLAAADNMP